METPQMFGWTIGGKPAEWTAAQWRELVAAIFRHYMAPDPVGWIRIPNDLNPPAEADPDREGGVHD